MPIQRRGPAPNGINANWLRLRMCRSGINSSTGSGPQSSSSKWIDKTSA